MYDIKEKYKGEIYMKLIKKIISLTFVFALVFVAFSTTSYATTVGQELTSKEDGWQRFDDNDLNIAYSGTWGAENEIGNYLKTGHRTTELAAKYRFKFFGTKLRIIVATSKLHSKNVSIKIDGVGYNYSEYSSNIERSILIFEKINMMNGYHTVEVENTEAGKYLFLDAIDIDDTGYLISENQPTNLVAIGGNAKVDLKWDAIDNATSYNVKRSMTSGGPYVSIGTSTTNTYTDKQVKNGTTYYYVVSAVVSGSEGTNSNEASATPKAGEIEGNKAILEIVMTNGTIKEYDLTATEIEDFLTWYDNRSEGNGKSYYRIPKKSNVKPFISRKEYLSYDKIYSFEVKDYNE